MDRENSRVTLYEKTSLSDDGLVEFRIEKSTHHGMQEDYFSTAIVDGHYVLQQSLLGGMRVLGVNELSVNPQEVNRRLHGYAFSKASREAYCRQCLLEDKTSFAGSPQPNEDPTIKMREEIKSGKRINPI